MTPASRWIYAITFGLAAAGFMLPFWPLAVIGILISVFSGRWLFGIVVALLIDLAWGAPTGALHFLYFPFTLLAAAGAAARIWGSRYFLDRNRQEKI